jgi:hypothetical protein
VGVPNIDGCARTQQQSGHVDMTLLTRSVQGRPKVRVDRRDIVTVT